MADLSKLVTQIQKAQGTGSIVRLGDREAVPVDVISTRIPSLDRALGIGGLPRGRVIEVIGQESGGKTTLTLQVIAEAQAQGGNAAFIDAEHAFDTTYAAKLGVDVDNLLVSQPDFGEQALEVAEALIRSGDVDVVVIDSVAALVPKNELEGEFGDAQMGLMARMMSQAMRKLTGAVAKSKCVLIFVNQIRSKIGVVFGSPETTTGGNALKFYASVRLDVRKIGVIKDGENPIGNKVRIKTLKNKLSSPYRETEVDLLFGYGFSRENDLVELAVSTGVAEKAGAWLTWNQERFHGVSAFQEHLRSNPEHLKKLEEQLK